jgi:hypothetical protein
VAGVEVSFEGTNSSIADKLNADFANVLMFGSPSSGGADATRFGTWLCDILYNTIRSKEKSF